MECPNIYTQGEYYLTYKDQHMQCKCMASFWRQYKNICQPINQSRVCLSSFFFSLKLLQFFLRRRTDGGAFRRLRCFTATHLPFHQLCESAVRVGAELLIGALFGHCSIRAENDDRIRALDGGQSMGNADGGIVAP